MRTHAEIADQTEKRVNDDEHQDDHHDDIDYGADRFRKRYDGKDRSHGPIDQAGNKQVNDKTYQRSDHGLYSIASGLTPNSFESSMTFYFDQPRNLLIYDRPSSLVLEHIPEAKRLNGQYVAVPRTLRNSQVLRWLNYPVAPIITDENYDLADRARQDAADHQKIMANFGVLHPRMFNLSDMGRWKTIGSWAADWL